jgi:hypothetical protein
MQLALCAARPRSQTMQVGAATRTVRSCTTHRTTGNLTWAEDIGRECLDRFYVRFRATVQYVLPTQVGRLATGPVTPVAVTR